MMVLSAIGQFPKFVNLLVIVLNVVYQFYNRLFSQEQNRKLKNVKRYAEKSEI